MMKVFIVPALLCLLFCISATNGAYRRICYFTNWSQYRPGAGSFTPKDIDPSLCSQIHYAFAVLKGNSLVPSEPSDLPANGKPGMYKEVINLKKQNSNLKVILTVGGYRVGNEPFSAIAASNTTREAFNKQAISYLRKYGFDGLEIDWEYPESKDKSNYATWAKELREAFDAEAKESSKEPLILTCAVAAGKGKIDAGYNVKDLAKYMDYITVMTYDLHGYWDHKVGQNAPLYAAEYATGYGAQLNVEWVMNYWVSKGASKEKLNVGLATYGRGFSLADSSNSKPGAPSNGPSPPGKYTGEGGFLAYYEICTMKTAANYHWMQKAKVPYVVNGRVWVGYDNAKSLKLKVNWLKSQGFGGLAVWTICLDDFNNMCKQGKYPLMKAINKALGISSPPGEVDAATPPSSTQTQKPGNGEGSIGGGGSSSGCNGKEPGFYAISGNCKSYLQCLAGGSKQILPCPPGTSFSTSLKSCDFSSNVPGC